MTLPPYGIDLAPFEAEYNSVLAVTSEAIVRCQSAADDLDNEANKLDALAVEMQDEIDRLTTFISHVANDAANYRTIARNWREFITPAQQTLF